MPISLAELTSLHWIGIALIALLGLVILSTPIIAVIRMNTTQHEHRQKLNQDKRDIDWLKVETANGRESRNSLRTNQQVMDAKLNFMIRNTPELDANYKTDIFDAIDVEPEKPQDPPLAEPA